MQLFPASSTVVDIAASMANHAQAALTADANGGEFQTTLSSFIEEGRSDYSGRPAGFAAYGPQSGTIDDETGREISKALRKRKVSEESIERLEQLMASGAPVTMGTLYGALSAKTRLTEALEGGERDAFKMALSKMGLTKDEQDELLALSDEGDTQAVWGRISARLKELDGKADITKTEWSALLKGLDMSKNTKETLLKLFGDADDQSLSGEQLEALLAGVSKEYAARNKAALDAQKETRGAILDAMASARLREQNASVQNNRGNRRSEQTEAMMQDSVRKNTGSDRITQDMQAQKQESSKLAAALRQDAQKQDAEESFENRKDGKSRSERILHTEADSRPKTSKAGEKSAEGLADKIFQRIDVAADAQSAPSAQQPAQNLNSLAQSYRREIFSQVEQGILQNAANGAQRLTLQLNPVELGQVTVVLSVHQGSLKATLLADQPESADALRAQLVELKSALEAEGLKVKELDVQTNLQDNNLAGRWDGHQEHNLMRDANERDRMMRLTRIRREAAAGNTDAEGAAPAMHQNMNAGLHIVA